jgi:hypothetical protein
MDFEKMENRETITVYSDRIAEILICECGLRELIGMFDTPDRNKKYIDKRAYVFRNSKPLFKVFKEYTYNENYKSKENKGV